MTARQVWIGAFAALLGLVVLADALAQRPAPVEIICESGSEYADPALVSDPYYVHSMDCRIGSSNGATATVILID